MRLQGPKPSRSSWRPAPFIAAAALLALTGCSPSGGSHHAGALSATTDTGSTSVFAPKHSPYTYTEGSFLLCRTSEAGSGELRLTGLTYDERLKPISITPMLRTIPPASQRTGRAEDWEPIGSAIGRPGAFHGLPTTGSYSTKIAGTAVRPTCQHPSDPKAAQLELQLVIRVPEAGSDITSFDIHYTVDGDEQVLPVHWRMVGCGKRTPRSMCTP